MLAPLLWLLWLTLLPAQDPAPLPARETALHTAATQSLLSFARAAEGNKMFARAKTAYQMVVDHYDPENKAARTALALKGRQWTDQGALAQVRSTEQAWTVVCKKLAPQHRDLGLAFVAADELARGPHHLQRCLDFDPKDVAAHEALGHESFRGFYGTPEQVAFCRRLEVIEQKAKELAATAFACTPLAADEVPLEFRNAQLAVVGAKARQWKVWTTSPNTEAASDAAQWAERGCDLLEFLLPSGPARRVARIDGRPVSWIGLLRNDAEWMAFFNANPQLLNAAKLTAAPDGSTFRFQSTTGLAEVFRHPVELDADEIIAHVTMWGFATQHNEGLGQGLVHAMTSLLVGTMHTWFGAEPPTRAAREVPLPRDPKAWAQRIAEEIRANQDWPLAQVPREKLTNFREQVRVKSWSFVLWMLARYPSNWSQVLQAIDSDQNLMPEQIEQIYVREFGVSLQQLDAEWREWARGDSPIAKATRSRG